MTPLTVMIVEDNAVTRRGFRRCVEAEGFVVFEAPDGKTALELAAVHSPALIVHDVHLPDMDGIDLLERLRAMPCVGTRPIVAVTGLPEKIPASAEFTEILTKPVEPSHLLRVVKSLLLANNVEPPPRSSQRRALVAEDDRVQRKVLRLHLQRWGFEVAEAANGAEALRLARSSRPDVIISDLLMPEVDGLSLCLALRGDATLAAVPVVLITSYHIDETDQTLAARSGAIAVVSRSADMAALGEVLLRVAHHDLTPADRGVRQRSTREDIHRLVDQMKREEGALDALAKNQAAVSSLLPFFESFSDLTSHGDIETTVDALLAGYLDASGAALGCAFLAAPDGALVLRSQLGYRESVAAELPTFFGRLDLIERVLAQGTTLELVGGEHVGDDIHGLLRHAGASSLMLVPLANGRERLGVFALGLRQATTSTDQLRIAEAARGPIAQALALSRRVSELLTSRQAFRGIVDSTSDAIVVADAAARITYANPAALQIFGYAVGDLIGRHASEVMPFLNAAPAAMTGRGVRRDHTRFPAAVTVTSFEDSPGHVLHAYVVRDMSLRETLEQLAMLANHDGLTGLFNRRRFDEHMTVRLREAVRYHQSGALVMLDLDGFKRVNDTYGHQAGDAVLLAVVNTLRANTRTSDFLARLGGDEFALEIPHTDMHDALVVAHKLIAALRSPIVWQGHLVQVGMSAGIAMYTEHGGTLESLVASADSALYRAKAEGRNRACTAGSAHATQGHACSRSEGGT